MERYRVGIDLGTSNTVVAYAEAGSDEIRIFAIEQLVSLGEVAARPLLPSLRYHPAAGELRDDDLQLPWPASDVPALKPAVIGSLARDLGALVPGRLVASAKSWLSHAAVDRTAPILPWGADEEVNKISPLAASASYLAYVRAAWNWHFPDAPLDAQELVLTVPASFDEGARALTVEAARLAGLPRLRLLEEPQAVFYDWLFRHRRSLAADLAASRLVLVCDVGGGTTDLTLIRVEAGKGAPGQPRLTRIGVSDHLMLGGDNMDLALAHRLEARMAASMPLSAGRLSASRLSQLILRCRAAKEQLLAAGAPERTAVTLLGGGAKLVGGTTSVELTRAAARELIVDGFFPRVAPEARPQRVRGGIVEFGLPYAGDPAITRHLAAFLGQHAAAIRQALGPDAPAEPRLPLPDTLLCNGGVFRAEALAERLEETLCDWRGEPLKVLHNDNPDVAVARGAVAYALAGAGLAPKIGGGSPRSYFLALEDEAQSPRGICLLPRGTEAGQEIRLADREFALRLGQPVRFHLLSSVADTPHRPGQLAELGAGRFVRLPPIATVVPDRGASGRREIPVQLTAALTEVGTLALHCVSTEDAAQRWRLDFQLRGDAAETARASAARHPRFAEALEKIERIFGARSPQVAPKEVRGLRAQLEHLLGPRATWDTPLLRELYGALRERARRRRRSPDHERLWLNLSGYCLRPGFGYPLDDWRVEQLWPLFEQGLQYAADRQNEAEWWTLWRRVAGGLPEREQLRLLDGLAVHPHLAGTAGPARRDDDRMRLAASLERVPVARRVEIGEGLLERLRQTANPQSCWALGRLGARVPFYGSAHNVVPPDIAVRWLDRLMALDWKKAEPAAFAATQLARLSGDRSRDLPSEARESVIRRLEAIDAAPGWIAMLRDVVELDEGDERRVFGESLPPGLKLIA